VCTEAPRAWCPLFLVLFSFFLAREAEKQIDRKLCMYMYKHTHTKREKEREREREREREPYVCVCVCVCE